MIEGLADDPVLSDRGTRRPGGPVPQRLSGTCQRMVSVAAVTQTTAQIAPQPASLSSGTCSPAERQRCSQSRVASEAHGVTSAPALTPTSVATRRRTSSAADGSTSEVGGEVVDEVGRDRGGAGEVQQVERPGAGARRPAPASRGGPRSGPRAAARRPARTRRPSATAAGPRAGGPGPASRVATSSTAAAATDTTAGSTPDGEERTDRHATRRRR